MKILTPIIPFHDLTEEEEVLPDDSQLEPHALADLFPSLPDELYYELLSDIEANGLVHSIMLFEGRILDGRHRYAAWQESLFNGYRHKLSKRQFPGNAKQALDFVISANLKRRMLNETQRSMVGEKIRKHFEENEDRPQKRAIHDELEPRSHKSRDVVTAARVMNVSPTGIERAKDVYATGIPELIQQTEAGKIPVSVAARVARKSPEQQAAAIKLPKTELRDLVRKQQPAPPPRQPADAQPPPSSGILVVYASFEVQMHELALRGGGEVETLRQQMLGALERLHHKIEVACTLTSGVPAAAEAMA